jgi:hypothetical protein
VASRSERLHGEASEQEQAGEQGPAGQADTVVEEGGTLQLGHGLVALEDGVHIHPGHAVKRHLETVSGL